MMDLSARTRVIAIGRPDGSLEYPPRRDTRFGAGDEAYLIGPYDEMLSVLRRDQTAAANPTGSVCCRSLRGSTAWAVAQLVAHHTGSVGSGVRVPSAPPGQAGLTWRTTCA